MLEASWAVAAPEGPWAAAAGGPTGGGADCPPADAAAAHAAGCDMSAGRPRSCGPTAAGIAGVLWAGRWGPTAPSDPGACASGLGCRAAISNAVDTEVGSAAGAGEAAAAAAAAFHAGGACLLASCSGGLKGVSPGSSDSLSIADAGGPTEALDADRSAVCTELAGSCGSGCGCASAPLSSC